MNKKSSGLIWDEKAGVPLRRKVCSGCRHYTPTAQMLGHGNCRCLPPQMVSVNQNGQAGMLPVNPVVNAQGWCGQWAHPHEAESKLDRSEGEAAPQGETK